MEFSLSGSIFTNHTILEPLILMTMNKIVLKTGYVSPEIEVFSIEGEGTFCLSGNHELFTLDETWEEYLEDE